MPYYTAIVTLLAVAFYFFLATRVAVAHGKFNVKLPATTGNPDFERISRVHVNTLEWMPTFLVPLWLCAIYLNDVAAAAIGLVWIGGRVLYFAGYSKAVEKRLPGFFIQSTVSLAVYRCHRGHRHAQVRRLISNAIEPHAESGGLFPAQATPQFSLGFQKKTDRCR
jgi:glutathione S-transferase